MVDHPSSDPSTSGIDYLTLHGTCAVNYCIHFICGLSCVYITRNSAMGGSITTFLHARPSNEVFLHPTGKDIYSKFVLEENATSSFAQFVKNGHWLSILTHHDHHASKIACVSNSPNITPRNNDSRWLFHHFNVPDSLKASVDDFLKQSNLNETIVSGSSSKKSWEHTSSMRSGFHESYKFNPEMAVFSVHEMSAIMCSILFPLYLQSGEYLHWSDTRNNSPSKNSTTGGGFSGVQSSSKDTTHTHNLQDLSGEVPDEVVGTVDMEHMKHMLLSTAAFLDESDIASLFSQGRSYQDAENAIDQAALGVCILSGAAELGESLVLYANAAFEKTSGHYYSQLSGKSLSVLLGESSEAAPQQHLNSAFHEKRAAKVVLTTYRRNKTKFLSALALKPAFDDQGRLAYWIVLVFDLSRRPASLAELKHVEDLLALIPNLLNYTTNH